MVAALVLAHDALMRGKHALCDERDKETFVSSRPSDEMMTNAIMRRNGTARSRSFQVAEEPLCILDWIFRCRNVAALGSLRQSPPQTMIPPSELPNPGIARAKFSRSDCSDTRVRALVCDALVVDKQFFRYLFVNKLIDNRFAAVYEAFKELGGPVFPIHAPRILSSILAAILVSR